MRVAFPACCRFGQLARCRSPGNLSKFGKVFSIVRVERSINGSKSLKILVRQDHAHGSAELPCLPQLPWLGLLCAAWRRAQDGDRSPPRSLPSLSERLQQIPPGPAGRPAADVRARQRATCRGPTARCPAVNSSTPDRADRVRRSCDKVPRKDRASAAATGRRHSVESFRRRS